MGEMADGPKQAIREAALILRSAHPHVVRGQGLRPSVRAGEAKRALYRPS